MKPITLVLFLFLCTVSVSGADYSDLFSIESSEGNAYLVTLKAGEYSLEKAYDIHGVFDVLRTDAMFKPTNRTGEPAIFSIPFSLSGEYAVTVLSAQYDTVENVILRPNDRPLMIGPDFYDMQSAPIYSDLYKKDIFWPETGVISQNKGTLRSVPVSSFKVTPFKYNAVRKTLLVAKSITLKLTRVGDVGHERGLQHPLVANVLAGDDVNRINPSSIESSGRAGKIVVFTIDSLLPAVNKLVRWQRLKGFEVVLKSKSDRYMKSDVITDIEKELVQSDAVSKYILFVGNSRMVQEFDVKWRYFNTLGNMQHITCTGYGETDDDNSDHLPDLARGVIPANNLKEAHICIDKIIKYETDPVTEESFYNNILGASQKGFVDEEVDVIMDYMDAKGWNTNPRLYLNEDKQRVIDRINEGVIIAAQYDHGYRGGWATPEFTGNQINVLTNGDKLPYMFSINCLSGSWDYANGMDKWNPKATYEPDFYGLTERFIYKENGGGVGALGATNITYTGYNDYLLYGLFKAIWPENDGQNPLYRIGDIVDFGLYHMHENMEHDGGQYDFCSYHFELYHNLCDPTMQIRTKVPTIVVATHNNFGDNDTQLKVTGINVPEATAVVYNEKTGAVIGRAKVNGASVSIPLNEGTFAKGDSVTLAINGINCTPFIETFVCGTGSSVLQTTTSSQKSVVVHKNSFSITNSGVELIEYELLNLLGRTLISGKVTGNTKTVLTKEQLKLASGTYVLKINGLRGIQSHRITFGN